MVLVADPEERTGEHLAAVGTLELAQHKHLEELDLAQHIEGPQLAGASLEEIVAPDNLHSVVRCSLRVHCNFLVRPPGVVADKQQVVGRMLVVAGGIPAVAVAADMVLAVVEHHKTVVVLAAATSHTKHTAVAEAALLPSSHLAAAIHKVLLLLLHCCCCKAGSSDRLNSCCLVAAAIQRAFHHMVAVDLDQHRRCFLAVADEAGMTILPADLEVLNSCLVVADDYKTKTADILLRLFHPALLLFHRNNHCYLFLHVLLYRPRHDHRHANFYCCCDYEQF
jgi:hypothetical protein